MKRVLLCTILALLSGSSHASASALLFGTSGVTLTILDISSQASANELTITGGAVVDLDQASATGSGSGTTTVDAEVLGDPGNLGIGDGFRLSADVFGTTGVPGGVDLFAFTRGFLDFTNLSLVEAFDVTLLLEYTMHAEASASAPATETAFVQASFDAFTSVATAGGDLVYADASVSPAPVVNSGTLVFTLTILPDSTDTLTVFADVLGSATAIRPPVIPDPNPVPAPGALALMAAGLCGHWLFTRSRRSSDAAARSSINGVSR